MRIPLDYGDNFPVLSSGRWNPSVPWRFPQVEVVVRRRPLAGWMLPWLMLGLGMTLGALGVIWLV
ncbi:MAG: hypothetical protein HYS41_00470 [Candidatus Omnitrophica bacterium]|nr:hypothetical protein [Candidatus Omnitrophota bacterium]